MIGIGLFRAPIFGGVLVEAGDQTTGGFGILLRRRRRS